MLLATFILCLQKEIIFAAKDKSRGCRSWRCRLKQSGRLRYFRNLSKQFYPSTNSLELALRSLNERQDGSFGSLSEEESEGYDIPKIECPMTEDNVEMLPCPTPDILNRIHCIDYYSLCDRRINCPNAEDEDPTMCLFHSVTDTYMKKMRSSIHLLFRMIQKLETSREGSYLGYERT